jgi:hypothetical protein
MKVIIRCVLAITAVVTCITLIRNNPIVLAQQCCTSYSCPQPPPACPNPACANYTGSCDYYWTCNSPIIVDVKDKGFHLTDQAHGVSFQFGNQKQQVAWTDPKYGNAWLALDRNGNGTIDDATELFGNDTPQPPSTNPNGFRALAVYDSPENGGNGDGYITAADRIYSQLLLWTDINHNGISEPNELQSLDHASITSISLAYDKDDRKDRYGNVFRYRSRNTMNSVEYDRLIYDVYLVGTNANSSSN